MGKKIIHSFSTDKTVDKSGCGCRKFTASGGLVPRGEGCVRKDGVTTEIDNSGSPTQHIAIHRKYGGQVCRLV